MNEVQPSFNNEVSYFENIEMLWNAKWRILFVTIAFVASSLFFYYLYPSSFTATTVIKPMKASESEKYRLFNSINFISIEKFQLLDLYAENLLNESSVNSGVRQLNLVDKTEFITEEEYQEAIESLVSRIKIISPKRNKDGEIKNEPGNTYKLSGEYHDIMRWNEFLTHLDIEANKSVREILLKRFDLQTLISKSKNSFRIDDLNVDISNAYEDYERNTKSKLDYLNEQATIARTLGIAKNTLESQLIGSQTTLVSNSTELPYYMRGYEAIEEEMKLIRSREDKKSFIEELINLEQEKRSVVQDRTADRAELIFASTPINSGDNFYAASLNINSTIYDPTVRLKLLIVISAIMGIISGVLITFISYNYKKYKIYLNKVK